MNTKLQSRLAGLAFIAALSMTTGSASAAVKFEAAKPSAGEKFAVRVVDAATGQPVVCAHVYVVQRQWMPIKGPMPFFDRRIELKPDSNGVFTYRGNAASGTDLPLIADICGSG